MEHPGVRRLPPPVNGISVIVSRQCRKVHEEVISLINQIGLASSRAQGLSHIITTFSSFSNGDMKMYILTEGGKKVMGFVKVGIRNLFLWDRTGIQHEKKTLCLLDFFTYPICQRRGHGRRMIDAMLEDQGMTMRQIPIDRPSALCLSFMKKHFGLAEFLPQSNNFVVFDEFWGEDQPAPPPTVHISQPLGNVVSRLQTTKGKVFQAIISHPAKRTHFNPITWSVHPGVDQ
jgi:alpha-tubulin N-acetyltransferase 1